MNGIERETIMREKIVMQLQVHAINNEAELWLLEKKGSGRSRAIFAELDESRESSFIAALPVASLASSLSRLLLALMKFTAENEIISHKL